MARTVNIHPFCVEFNLQNECVLAFVNSRGNFEVH